MEVVLWSTGREGRHWMWWHRRGGGGGGVGNGVWVLVCVGGCDE